MCLLLHSYGGRRVETHEPTQRSDHSVEEKSLATVTHVHTTGIESLGKLYYVRIYAIRLNLSVDIFVVRPLNMAAVGKHKQMTTH